MWTNLQERQEVAMGQQGQDVGISAVSLWLTFRNGKPSYLHSPITASEVLGQQSTLTIDCCG